NGVAGPGQVVANDVPLSPLQVGFDESFSVSNYFETVWTFGHNGVSVKTKGDGSEVIVAEALKHIERLAKRNKPFFTLIWFGSPHIPCTPLAKDLEAAGGSGYYGELIAVDRSMGTLRAGLRKLGIAENTMLWFSSDNGGYVGNKNPSEHGTNGPLRGQKADIWEGGIRVPGLIEWPAKIAKPVITEMPAGLVDIYPTLVDLLKIDVPNQIKPIDGISLMPLLEGKMTQRPKPMGFLKLQNGPAAWSDNRYKLISTKPDQWELYDLTADISESNDIAVKHPEVVQRMKAELQAWQQSVANSFKGMDYPEKEVVQPAKPKRKKRSKDKDRPALPKMGSSTQGIIDLKQTSCPEGGKSLVGQTGYDLMPESGVQCLWTFKDGVLTASPKWDSVITRDNYRDFQMHVEFNVNDAPNADPEGNGNSGVYIQQRYEIQILNSYGISQADYKASYCGSLYRMKMPDKLVNKPAGEWQSFDIAFRAARFDGDKKSENARITVYQNGQLVHDDVEFKRQTGAGMKEGSAPRPIKLQGHHNPVQFRNVWVQPLNLD
ncbi:MAG: DUF1080 domain-containing protein, partial [Phycisphaerae bacterium]|nr:DUF1080 domain-containing protein [Phycisphaerae bacterium]